MHTVAWGNVCFLLPVLSHTAPPIPSDPPFACCLQCAGQGPDVVLLRRGGDPGGSPIHQRQSQASQPSTSLAACIATLPPSAAAAAAPRQPSVNLAVLVIVHLRVNACTNTIPKQTNCCLPPFPAPAAAPGPAGSCGLLQTEELVVDKMTFDELNALMETKGFSKASTANVGALYRPPTPGL